jgi:hypothetical protein
METDEPRCALLVVLAFKIGNLVINWPETYAEIDGKWQHESMKCCSIQHDRPLLIVSDYRIVATSIEA